MPKIEIPFGKEILNISIPENWEIINSFSNFKTFCKDSLKREAIDCANSLISKIKIELKNRATKTIAIVVDDHTRPTPVDNILEPLIEGLVGVGIDKKNITVIAASGAHRMMSDDDLRSKVGDFLFSELRCMSHDFQNNLVFIGNTSSGTPVNINADYWNSDLKIGIGSIIPHDAAGFGGGSKIIAPGILGIDSIEYIHTRIPYEFVFAETRKSIFKREIDEIARLSGLNYIFNIVWNLKGKPQKIFFGDFEYAHEQGITYLKDLSRLKITDLADVVIANSYPLDCDFYQSEKGLFPAIRYCKNNGFILWLSSCPEGIGYHYLSLNNKKYYEGYLKTMEKIARNFNVYFYSKNLSKNEFEYLNPYVKFTDSIEATLEEIELILKNNTKQRVLITSPFYI